MAQEICRICLINCKTFYDYNYGTPCIRKKLEEFMPNMDLNIIEKPVICETCLISINYCYTLLKSIKSTENKIIAYKKNINGNKLLEIKAIQIYRITTDNDVEIKNVHDDKTMNVDIKLEINDEINLKQSNDITQDPSFPCKLCKKSFQLALHLRLHEISHKKFNATQSKAVTSQVKPVDVSDDYNDTIDSADDEQSQKSPNYDIRLDDCDDYVAEMENNENSDSSSERNSESSISQDTVKVTRKRSKLSKHGGRVTCRVCAKVVCHREGLKRHMLTHTKMKQHKCTKCDKQFQSPANLLRHQVVHTGLKPFVCDICENSFTDVSTLRAHVKAHSGKRDHKCTICGAAFLKQQGLRRHMVRHDKGLKQFSCTTCKSAFRDNHGLNIHIGKVHPFQKK